MTTRRNTKEALIDSAERLIATKGLGAVSVKDITQAAGARNPSAVHYHFGNMETLMREVFSRRFRHIQQEQLARLSKVLPAKDNNQYLIAMFEAMLAPFIETCGDECGRLYVRFCYQLTTDPRFNVSDIISDFGMESMARLRQRVVECLKDIPDEVLVVRLRQGVAISMLQAADYAARFEAGTALPIKQAVREAAVCQAGYLSAKP